MYGFTKCNQSKIFHKKFMDRFNFGIYHTQCMQNGLNKLNRTEEAVLMKPH